MECAEELGYVVLTFYVIFQFWTGTSWHEINVTLFKKGSKNDPSNYGPVSLASVLGKVFETLLKKRIVTFLETNYLLLENQYGF